MIFYILNVALILAGCLAFYKVLLQKETFFPLNRFVLLACLALSFSIPLIPVPQQWSFRAANTVIERSIDQPVKQKAESEVVKAPVQEAQVAINKTGVEKNTFFKDFSIVKGAVWLYWLGVIVFAINFIVQLLILLYRAYSRPVIVDGNFRIVELSGNQAPCSFGNNIFINPDKYDWDTYSQIIMHEKIHIQQRHSYDILFAELAIIFQWFNPFAWLYRKAIEDNLEFLTDNELLAHTDVERSSYQMSLVKVSAPHFPISLTTNYNQSILKKRLMMMNAKKSNVNSTWKYLFIIPLLLVFISFLNEPVAYGKTNRQTRANETQFVENEGTWFATIKNEKVTFRFESDEDGKSNSSNTFSLTELKNLPLGKTGEFSLTRDAGTILFTGKFEGNTGMGTYKFNADNSFIDFLKKEGITGVASKDAMVFYMVNVDKDFIKMLKAEGYQQISKNDLIPLAALKVNASFIRSLKDAGIANASLSDLIPLKALGVDGEFIKDIKSAGYKNLSADRLITLKSQGIDGNYIKNAKSANAENRVSTRNSKKEQNDLEDEMSALGELIAKKALNITSDYVKSFAETGLKNSDSELIAMKSLGITADYIKSFEEAGLKIKADEAISLKSLGITADEFNTYRKLGFKGLSIDDVISAKATGTSPAFISSMKKKGHNYLSIDKYVQMKVLAID
ncbi:MAG: M56 family metallopeptidase [Bacteroidota bacterium]